MGEKKRKGQVSVFVLLGLVLVVVIIIMVMAASIASESRLKREAETAVEQYMESSTIDYYVYTCIDTAVKETLEEFSRQGGVFYEDQGGPIARTEAGKTHIPFNETVDNKVYKFNVSYGIENRNYCTPFVEEAPPLYPSIRTHLDDMFMKYTRSNNNCRFDTFYKLSGFAGVNNFTRLCYLSSENALDGSHITSPCNSVSVKSRTPIKELSAEDQLSNRIANKTQECINFTIFQTTEAHNITVVDNATSNITLKKTSLGVDITYPFRVKLKGHQPVLIRHTFSYESRIRITQIMRYLISLITREVQRPEFDMSKDFAVLSDFDAANMDIEMFNFYNCTNCPYKNDTMIKLTDHASKIGNKSLTFYTAIKGRIPILDFIHDTDENETFDIIVEENDTIYIRPFGIDPENYDVEYSYDKWKESYDERFDFNGDNNASCNVAARLASGTGFTLKEIEKCMIKNETVSPKNWTTSTLYTNTSQNASYKTNRSDMGIHELSVIVRDVTGKIDWQDVKILVMDKPNVNLTIMPPYPNMPLNVISREDFFKMNASGSTPSVMGGGTITSYLWEAFKTSTALNLFKYVTSPPVDAITVPFRDSNIQNISSMNISSTGKHTLRLTVQTNAAVISGSGVKSIDVDVMSCIPYRDSDTIFPYGPDPTLNDPYYFNHTCCAGNITNASSYGLLGSSNICYQEDVYGEFEKIRKYYNSNLTQQTTLQQYFNAEGVSPPSVPSLTTPPSDPNDVYKLEFERKCDGVRGNICAGDVDANIVLQDNCAYNSTLDEQCEGPKNGLTADLTQATCDTYNRGTTFESKYAGGSGFCETTPQCSEKGVNGYDGDALTGYAMCKGQCDGVGGCTYAADCVCSTTGKCGSECKPPGDYPYIDSTTLKCVYKCDTSASSQCKEEKSAMPCIPAAGQNYCKSSSNICYKDVACTAGGATGTPTGPCPPGKSCMADGSCV